MTFLKQGKTNWKFLLIVVILAAIIGGGILAYQYLWLPKEEAKNSQRPVVCTQEAKVCPDGSTVGRTGPNCEFAECPTVKTDETADWQTYRNEEYGFEFKYPPIPSGCEQCIISKNSNGFNVNTTDFLIKNSGGLNLSDFVNKEMEGFTIEKKEEMIIGGENGINIGYRFGGTNRFGSIAFIEKDDKVFVFSFTAGGFCCNPNSDKIYEAEVYGAMLSTFRFLETEDETANWQTYTNSRVRYKFSYPSTNLTLALDETIKYPSTREGDSKTQDLVQFAVGKTSFGIRTYVGEGKSTIESWIQEPNTPRAYHDLSKYEKVTVGGKTAYRIKGEAFVYVLANKNVYEITVYQNVAPIKISDEPLFEKWVATIEFIK